MTSTTSIGARNAGLDGYVHKFRFETEPVFMTAVEIEVENRLAAITKHSEVSSGRASSEVRLLVGFVISVIVLSGLLLAVVSALRP